MFMILETHVMLIMYSMYSNNRIEQIGVGMQ